MVMDPFFKLYQGYIRIYDFSLFPFLCSAVMVLPSVRFCLNSLILCFLPFPIIFDLLRSIPG